VPRGVFTFWNP